MVLEFFRYFYIYFIGVLYIFVILRLLYGKGKSKINLYFIIESYIYFISFKLVIFFILNWVSF